MQSSIKEQLNTPLLLLNIANQTFIGGKQLSRSGLPQSGDIQVITRDIHVSTLIYSETYRDSAIVEILAFW